MSEELIQKIIDNKITIKISKGDNCEELLYQVSGKDGQFIYTCNTQYLNIQRNSESYPKAIENNLLPLCMELLQAIIESGMH